MGIDAKYNCNFCNSCCSCDDETELEKGNNMSLKDWKYYNHAVIPAVEPHEQPDLTCIRDKSIWKVGGVYRFLQDGLRISTVVTKQAGGTA